MEDLEEDIIDVFKAKEKNPGKILCTSKKIIDQYQVLIKIIIKAIAQPNETTSNERHRLLIGM